MTTLPCTCRPAWSSTAARICPTGKLAAMGTRSWPAATRRAGGAVVDAVGGMVRVAARRDGPGRVYQDVVGDRAGQGAAEHPVAGREPGHAVTGLVHDPGIVGSESGRQAQAESAGGAGV